MTTPHTSQAPAPAPTENQLRAARRAVAQHRRRRYPDTGVCGLCGYRWQAGVSPSGKPYRGCLRRRRALDLLDAGGQLDGRGRPVTPAP